MLADRAKRTMDQMFLFSIKVVTHAIVGRVKEKLKGLVKIWLGLIYLLLTKE